MDEKSVSELLNRITVRRYLNLYFSGDDKERRAAANDTVKRIMAGKLPGDCYIDVNIDDLPESEESANKSFAAVMNDRLSGARLNHWIQDDISIGNALEQLNKKLEKPALIIFYYFRDQDSKKEKYVLRSIRKFIEMRESLFLGILILSSDGIENWDLFPYSNLDERHVESICR